jgi:glycerate kinase
MLRALGFWFVDGNGDRWERGGPPRAPAGFETIGLRESLRAFPFVGCCDVLSRFLDAPRLYGPQKGASANEVAELTRRLRRLARFAPPEDARLPGSGAAGGLGWALAAFLDARLVPGAKLVLDEIGFDRELRSADLLLTGEGKWDRTTREGKAPWEAMRRARRAGVPCAALCGRVEGRARGVRAIARSAAEGMRRAAALLEKAACEETLRRAH